LRVSISQRLWIQLILSDLIARNDVDVRVHRSAQTQQAVDEVVKVRSVARQLAVVKLLEAVTTIQSIVDLKNQPVLNRGVTEVAVQNDEVAPVLAGQVEATLWVVVMMCQ